MMIRTDFDSGNIEPVDLSEPGHARLAIRPDLRSAHFQWFHFQVDGLAPGQVQRFSLINAGQSAYPFAWPGYQAIASYDHVNWFRVPTRYEEGVLEFTLAPEQSRVWFAYFEPYSRERHAALIARALTLPGVEQIACGTSVEGRALELLRVQRNPAATRKLWIIAQQHPGEHMAEWFMEGVIDRLGRSDDAELDALLDQATLYLIPNMNPDGAFRGHLRTNAAGKDLNRQWAEPSREESPEVFFALEQMQAIGVDAFLDIHGDETIPHVFAAGCEGNPGYSPRLQGLEDEFRQRLIDNGAEFQSQFGYPRDEPGKARPSVACNAVGQRFDCLSFTIEMPFKDHDDRPAPTTGWNGERSAKLGQDVLTVLAQMVATLR